MELIDQGQRFTCFMMSELNAASVTQTVYFLWVMWPRRHLEEQRTQRVSVCGPSIRNKNTQFTSLCHFHHQNTENMIQLFPQSAPSTITINKLLHNTDFTFLSIQFISNPINHKGINQHSDIIVWLSLQLIFQPSDFLSVYCSDKNFLSHTGNRSSDIK